MCLLLALMIPRFTAASAGDGTLARGVGRSRDVRVFCMSTGSGGEHGSEMGLLERIKLGDEDAFSQFYDRFSPLLFGVVFKILNDSKEAEDVVQEGFLHVWNRAGTYDATRSSPATWATMIFRHKAIDRLRSRARRDRRMEQAALEPELIFNAQEGPARAASRNEEKVAIAAAMSKLPSDQREAIGFAFISGLTQEEIAKKLATPLGTVKARIRRGMLKLREYLTGEL